jgi:hypothetical protein
MHAVATSVATATFRLEHHWVHRWVHEQGSRQVYLERLFEEAEGESCGNTKTTVLGEAASCGGSSICCDLRRLWADLQEEASLVSGLPVPNVLNLNCVRRNATLGIVNFDLDLV